MKIKSTFIECSKILKYSYSLDCFLYRLYIYIRIVIKPVLLKSKSKSFLKEDYFGRDDIINKIHLN